MHAEYNSIRFVFTLLIAVFFGTAFWQMGSRRRVQAALPPVHSDSHQHAVCQ